MGGQGHYPDSLPSGTSPVTHCRGWLTPRAVLDGCLGMRYLSNCFQNDIIHNQSVGRISWLCGYYPLSENHLNSTAAIWDSSYYPDQTGIHPASRSVDTGVLSWGKSGLGMMLTTHLHTQPR